MSLRPVKKLIKSKPTLEGAGVHLRRAFGFGLYGGSKLAPQFLVEVLAKEIGGRGITVNSILPSATEGAGVSTKEVRPQVREFIRNNNPMQRMATLEDVANAAEYLAGDLSDYVSGQHLLLSGEAPA